MSLIIAGRFQTLRAAESAPSVFSRAASSKKT